MCRLHARASLGEGETIKLIIVNRLVVFRKILLLARLDDIKCDRPGSRYLYTCIPQSCDRVNDVLTINTRIEILLYIRPYSGLCGVCVHDSAAAAQRRVPEVIVSPSHSVCSPCRVRNQLEVGSAQMGVTREAGWTNSPAALGLDAGHVCVVCVYLREKKPKVQKKSTRKYVILTLGISRWSRIKDNLTDDCVLNSFSFYVDIFFYTSRVTLYINIFDNFCNTFFHSQVVLLLFENNDNIILTILCGGGAVLRYPRSTPFLMKCARASSRVCGIRFLQLPCLVALQRR